MLVPVDSRRKSSTILLLLTYVCAEAAFVIAVVSGPTFQRVLSLSDTQLGLCLGAMPLGILLGAALMGHATARYGPYRILCLGLGALLFSLGLVVLARGVGVLLMALTLAGMSMATFHNAGLTVLSDLYPRSMRRVMSLTAGLWFASSVVSAPVIGAWLARAERQGLTYASWGLPGVVAMVVIAGCLLSLYLKLGWTVALHRRPAPDAEQAAHEAGWGWLWLPALGFWYGIMVATFLAWGNPLVQAVFGADDFQGSLAFGVFALGLASGRFLLVAYRLKLDDRLLLGISCLGGGLLLALALSMPSYALTLLMIGLGAFLINPALPCLSALVAGEFPRIKARLYGYQEASVAGGGVIGSFVVGLMVDLAVPMRLALLIAPLGGILVGVGSLVWRELARRSQQKCRTCPPSPPSVGPTR